MENKINISNYEAYLLDFMEGNLSEADCALLREFVLLHPELEINLEDTELVTLEAESISLGSKENLKKSGVTFSDEHFIGYIENTLSSEEKEQLELACSADAALAKELRLYKSTILETDTSIIFKDKSSLRKQSKIIYFNARVFVSAAAALLLIFGLWFVFRNVDGGNSNTKNLSEIKNSIPSNTLAAINTNSASNESVTYTSQVNMEKQQSPKRNLASNTKQAVLPTNTTSLIANNIIDTIKPRKEEKLIELKKEPEVNEVKIANNNVQPAKTNYIITEGTDDELADNNITKEKTGFWSKASKALKNLNKLGVKKVDAHETVTVNSEQTLLSLGNFKIEKNRYNQE